MLLQKRFEQRFADRVLISVQSPVRLLPDSEPQPDLVLLKPPLETYRNRLPQAEDILLLIEVADSSLEYDRNEKLPIYARAEIPEVWIVNLKDKQLEVYSEPKNGRYGQLKTYEEGSEVAPRAFDESINCWG
jgi:Uma2 family endonuclease